MRLFLWRDGFIYFSILWLFLLLVPSCQKQSPSYLPNVLDPRLQMEVILEAPDILTPIGLTIDDQDNLYVLESHTHFPGQDYQGPKYDRIKKGIDEDGDGRPDTWVIYADNIDDGMNIEWFQGKIYLVEKDSVLVLSDNNGDGLSDQEEVIIQMIPATDVFDHAGLLGITVSDDGWIYVSRGNCAGVELKIIGSDRSIIDSYGDGGSVFRCRTDGSRLELIARGFWNPFDIKFIKSGRLMVVDNDPDSRGPNRLLEIVPGGNYGYESLYGSSGIHPFLAWDGELPGTLPYAAGLGEAPSGLIDASYTNLPEAYRGEILATIWEENSIVRIPLRDFQSTVKGEQKVLIQGDSSFHPVAMAANSRGDLFITDWVKRQYPNHGYGRLYMLSSGSDKPIDDSPPAANRYLNQVESEPDIASLIVDLKSDDPFIRTLSRFRLTKGDFKQEVLDLFDQDDPELKMQALLTASQTDWEISSKILGQLLENGNTTIRRMTLIYLATHQRMDMYGDVIEAFRSGFITSDIFETYLETIKYLQPDFVESFKSREKPIAKQIKVQLPEKFIESIITNESLPDEIRSITLPYLEDIEGNLDYLVDLFATANDKLKNALLLAIKDIRSEELSIFLKGIALDQAVNVSVRAQALTNLEFQSGNYCDEIKYLIKSKESVIAETASRYLCRCGGSDEDIVQLMDEVDHSIKSIWDHCNGNVSSDRATEEDSWISILNSDGNPENGWMIFQSPKAMCISCHSIDKWGGHFGPDLSNIGASKSREQLIYAILEPDMEMAPEWQGWYVVDEAGTTYFGRQIDLSGSGKNAELMMADGKFVNFKNIQSYGLAPNSLMPDGLEIRLTVGEMEDLIAFLTSLK